MNKEEILQYLIDLRQITAPMAKARQRFMQLLNKN